MAKRVASSGGVMSVAGSGGLEEEDTSTVASLARRSAKALRAAVDVVIAAESARVGSLGAPCRWRVLQTVLAMA
uniref:Uncharacterized protein n=1 Tax=Oryza glumipatula TaxID=40148 RepID=A0A0E0AIZ4_9ORYZ